MIIYGILKPSDSRVTYKKHSCNCTEILESGGGLPLNVLQDEIEGYIDIAYNVFFGVFNDPTLCAIVDDAGHLKGLDYNIPYLDGFLAGKILFCRRLSSPEGDILTGLTSYQMGVIDAIVGIYRDKDDTINKRLTHNYSMFINTEFYEN